MPYQPKCFQSCSCLFRLFFFLLFPPYYYSPLICLLFTLFFLSSFYWLIIHLPSSSYSSSNPFFFNTFFHILFNKSDIITLLPLLLSPIKLWERESLLENQKIPRVVLQICISILYSGITDNNLILYIYIIIKKNYHTYIELVHVFYTWFGIILNN